MPGCWWGGCVGQSPLQPIHPSRICCNLRLLLRCWAQPVRHRLQGAQHQAGTPPHRPLPGLVAAAGQLCALLTGQCVLKCPRLPLALSQAAFSHDSEKEQKGWKLSDLLKTGRGSVLMCSTAAARHVARPGTAQLPRQPCAVTRSSSGPHVPLHPLKKLWEGTEGCVGSRALWQPGVCHHSRALECCSSHTDRACQAAHTAGGSLLQRRAEPALLLGHAMKGPVAAGRDKTSPFFQEGRVTAGVLSADPSIRAHSRSAFL